MRQHLQADPPEGLRRWVCALDPEPAEGAACHTTLGGTCILMCEYAHVHISIYT